MMHRYPRVSRSITAALLKNASDEGWAVGQFNAENLEFAQAIAEASRSERAPVIVAASAKTLEYMRPVVFVSMVRTLFAATGAETILHLDHGDSFELAVRCVDAGFDSVMIDGSTLPFDQNVQLTREVVEYAHEHDVFVEGELGHVGGKEEDIITELDRYTTVEEATTFVEQTGVDSLAIAVGTSHGAFKFPTGAELAYDRIQEIHEVLTTPLVLHGASGIDPVDVERVNQYGGKVENASGLPAEDIRKAIKAGIAKINIATDLRLAFLGGLRESLDLHPEWIDPRKYLGRARAEARRVAVDKLHLLGSAGKVA